MRKTQRISVSSRRNSSSLWGLGRVVVLLLALLFVFVVEEQRVEASSTTTTTPTADTTTTRDNEEQQQPHKQASGTKSSNNDNKERRKLMDMGNDFCNGMSMTMAMRGFQSSLFWHGSRSVNRHHHGDEEQEAEDDMNSKNNKADCLTYLVEHWKLDTAGQFVGAMVYSFLLALMTEALTSVQGRIKNYLPIGSRTRTVIMSIFYAVQQFSGYLVMFIAMTYSIELFASALLGLMAGNFLYLRGSDPDEEEDDDEDEQEGMVALMGNSPQQRRDRAARLLLVQEEGGGGGSLVGGGCCNTNTTGNMDEQNEEEVALIADRSNAGDYSIDLGGAFGTDDNEERSPLMDSLSAASTKKQVDNNSAVPLRRRR
jgi:hypothetical protein